MLTFAPEITELIDRADEILAGGGNIEAFEAALVKAEEFHNSQKAQFDIYFASRPGQTKLQNLGLAVDEGFTERNKGFNNLKLYLQANNIYYLEQGIEAVIKGSLSIAGNSIDLRREDHRMRFSRYPLLDDAVKACMNIYQKKEEPDLLKIMMPELVRFANHMEGDLKEFSILFPDEKTLKEEYRDLIRLFTGSVGALQLFLDDGDKDELYTGSQCLFVSGHEFTKLTRKIAAMLRKKWADVEVPYVEKVRVALEAFREGRIDKEELEYIFDGIRGVHNSFPAYLDYLEDSILPSEFKERLFPGIRLKVELQNDVFAQLADEPGLMDKYGEISIGIRNDFQAVRKELGEAGGGLERASDYENMRDLIRGFHAGLIPVRFFHQMINEFENQLDRALEIEKKENARNALLDQKDGLEELKLFFQDYNKEHVMEGWRRIDSGVKIILGMMTGLEHKAAEEAMLPCVKCGTPNIPEVQHCVNCGAFMPFSKLARSERERFSVKEGEEARPKGTMGQNIAVLQDLIQRLENGQASIQELEAVVGSLLKQAQDTRAGFEKLLPALKKAEEKDNCKNFIEAVREFEEGLERMLVFSVQRNFSNLVEGFSKVSAAGDRLASFV